MYPAAESEAEVIYKQPPIVTDDSFYDYCHSRSIVQGNTALRLLFTQGFFTLRCLRCVKIKDTDDVLPVKEGPRFPW